MIHNLPRKNIFILSASQDHEALGVINEIGDKASVTHFTEKSALSLEVKDGKATWFIDDLVWSTENPPPFSAVYVRMTDSVPMPPSGLTHTGTYHEFMREIFYSNERATLRLSLLGSLEEAGVRMYNSPQFSSREFKPQRISDLASSGVPVPSSFYSSHGPSLNEFALKTGRIVMKPLSRGFAKEVSPDLFLNNPLPERAPVVLNELVPGSDFRIFICDGQVIGSVAVQSSKEVDSRYFETGFTKFSPTPQMIDHAILSAKVCKLRFSGIDFRIDSTGKYKILEANAMPMFRNFEKHSGVPITANLVEHLLK